MSRKQGQRTLFNGTSQPTNLIGAFVKMSKPKPTVVYATYWRFAKLRQDVYFRRLAGCPPPWTDDWILEQYRFTNVYRASDRVSQELIRRVLVEAEGSCDTFFRCLLFKVFNKIETWNALENEVGAIHWTKYDRAKYDAVFQRLFALGTRMFSNAYIMPSGSSVDRAPRKFTVYLNLLERMMRDGAWQRVESGRSLKRTFEVIRSYPLMGDFLAFQYATDLNYYEPFAGDEDDFVVAGPGAKSGMRKCFSDPGEFSERDIIMMMRDRQETDIEALGLEFRSLFGRRLKPIDCQNLFCEVDKYSRLAHPEVNGLGDRKRIKQIFRPAGAVSPPVFPRHWGITENVDEEIRATRCLYG